MNTRRSRMMGRVLVRGGVILGLLLAVGLAAFEGDAWARAGGGRSFRSRGSRSFSAPNRPYGSPGYGQPSPRQYSSQPATPAPATPVPTSPAGGFWRGLAGGIAGGFLGSLLFSSLGWGAGGLGGFGGGLGLLEVLLLAGLAYGLYWFVKRRNPEPAHAHGGHAGVPISAHDGGGCGGGGHSHHGTVASTEPSLEESLEQIRRSDPDFSEPLFREQATDLFFRIQAAWAARDLAPLRNSLADDIAKDLGGAIEDLKREHRINRLENVAVRSVETVEAWQEDHRDFVTVRFLANLLDYTVNEESGQIVAGSRVEPVRFEEYWTFVRPTARGPWQLSAINQA